MRRRAPPLPREPRRARSQRRLTTRARAARPPRGRRRRSRRRCCQSRARAARSTTTVPTATRVARAPRRARSRQRSCPRRSCKQSARRCCRSWRRTRATYRSRSWIRRWRAHWCAFASAHPRAPACPRAPVRPRAPSALGASFGASLGAQPHGLRPTRCAPSAPQRLATRLTPQTVAPCPRPLAQDVPLWEQKHRAAHGPMRSFLSRCPGIAVATVDQEERAYLVHRLDAAARAAVRARRRSNADWPVLWRESMRMRRFLARGALFPHSCCREVVCVLSRVWTVRVRIVRVRIVHLGRSTSRRPRPRLSPRPKSAPRAALLDGDATPRRPRPRCAGRYGCCSAVRARGSQCARVGCPI